MRAVDGRTLSHRFATLALAGLGGLAASALGLPVAWLLGPVLAVSAASIAGLDTELPQLLRTLAFFVLGVQAGSGVTPDVLEQIAIWPLSFAVQMLGVGVVIVLTHAFLHRMLRWDKDTALFASLPGALSFVLAAASETRADLTRITIVQSVRLLFLIGALTPILAWLEGGADVVAMARGTQGTLADYALLFGLCALVAFAGHLIRLPGGMMLGALIGSGALHVGGVSTVAIPPVLAIPSLVLLGTLIGSRLKGIDIAAFSRLLPAAIGSFAIGLVVSAAAAAVAVVALGIGFGKVALAYAPGALEALTVLAFQFDVDPAYVAAHHVVRFVSIAMVVPLLAKRRARPGDTVAPPIDEKERLSGVDGSEDRG
ncbi:AbrB family transcriptional regulator [Aurantimonas marianensis]|uniref:AbrB family transcriptional regulator n=1 Tax=Aurantimonas marianensis TaxID=2920428 RepID=A0A9X2H9N0_9HYPH|nr:AbrB family transcriptional regulator [Aurantimonas marianensis]